MRLRDIKFEEEYRSGDHDVLNQFFRPALRATSQYWRAVGYFSSSALESMGAPLAEFIRGGGTIRLVTSVELVDEDIQAIEQGLSSKEICERKINEIIEREFANGVGDGVAALVFLLQTGRLEIRIARPTRGLGIYHEKVGLFFDGEDFVAFSGSTNESRQAFERNYECLDIFPSWEMPSRALRKRARFDRLWRNEDPGAEVMLFPDAARERLLRAYSRVREKESLPIAQGKPHISWRHQIEAREVFVARERGVLNMATGTGKTRTAVDIIRDLTTRGLIRSTIIATEGNDLLNQWYRNVLGGFKDLPTRFRVYQHYGNYRELNEYLLNPEGGLLLCSRGFLHNALRGLHKGLHPRLLLVHDEVHGLGSPGNRAKLQHLSDDVRYRLGLSATPEREYDPEGNSFVEDQVGPVIYEFGLEAAIERGILVPFEYVPLPYQLTPEDRVRLANVYKRKAARAAEGNPMSNEELWIDLAKVYKTSSAKLPVFADYVASHSEVLQRCIVFVETQEYGDEALKIVHSVHPEFHTYFSGEDSNTLQRFARGDLECLITCHRLSEGIDIRSLNSVVLFSAARAKLETIQRMGRCLRRDETSPEKIATVIDFVRTSQPDEPDNADTERYQWLTALSRTRYSQEGENNGHR